jgi:hypothetical protein
MSELEPFTDEFLARLRRRADAAATRLHKLGTCDVRFAARSLRDDGTARVALFACAAYSLVEARAVTEPLPDDVDFVLTAPEAVWRRMLRARAGDGADDDLQTINTLTHFDHPMRVEADTPEGQDKLFRFQETIQLLFDLAG